MSGHILSFKRMAAAQRPVCTVLYNIAGVCFVVGITVCETIVLIVVVEKHLFDELLVRMFTGKYVHSFHLLDSFCMIRPLGLPKVSGEIK